MARGEAILDFRITAQPHLARMARQVVSDFGAANAIDADDLGYLLLALGEALANAIEHACATDAIDIEVRVDDAAIMARVHDSGVGFESDRLEEPRLPSPDSERGRGLAIMRRCSDMFRVETEPGKGTSVVFGRYRREAVTTRSNLRAHAQQL